MAGGSIRREDVTEQRCEHCGLFYSSQGITTHEPNCPVSQLPVDVVPVVDGEVQTEGLGRDLGAEAEPHDGVEDGVSSDPDPERDGPRPAADGGLGLEGAPDRDVDGQDGPDSETYDCTECDVDLEVTDEQLDGEFTAATDRHGFRGYVECDDCGHRMGWSG